jgi:hypothetical protein
VLLPQGQQAVKAAALVVIRPSEAMVDRFRVNIKLEQAVGALAYTVAPLAVVEG